MKLSRLPAISLMLAITAGSLAHAQRGMAPGWGHDPFYPRSYDRNRPYKRDRSAEGQVEVTRFTASGGAASALGSGPISVTSSTIGAIGVDPRNNAVFEAAVVDRLIELGYNTAAPADTSGQVVELRIIRDVVEPPERKRKPVSGEMAVGVSNRGSMVGMGINVDMTKPLSALISTRLEIRIRDRVSDTVLWEGRAEMMTREGSERWTTDRIAGKLAMALFGGFPGKSGETEIIR